MNTLNDITKEVEIAFFQKRDFSISHQDKAELVRKFGVDEVIQTLLRAIRCTRTPLIDQLDPTTASRRVETLITRIHNETKKLHENHFGTWVYCVGKQTIEFGSDDSLLLRSSSSSRMPLYNGETLNIQSPSAYDVGISSNITFAIQEL